MINITPMQLAEKLNLNSAKANNILNSNNLQINYIEDTKQKIEPDMLNVIIYRKTRQGLEDDVVFDKSIEINEVMQNVKVLHQPFIDKLIENSDLKNITLESDSSNVALIILYPGVKETIKMDTKLDLKPDVVVNPLPLDKQPATISNLNFNI